MMAAHLVTQQAQTARRIIREVSEIRSNHFRGGFRDEESSIGVFYHRNNQRVAAAEAKLQVEARSTDLASMIRGIFHFWSEE